MKLLFQKQSGFDEDDACEACGCSLHWGAPLLLEQYNSICFNGILVEVTTQEISKFKRSIKEYEKENKK